MMKAPFAFTLQLRFLTGVAFRPQLGTATYGITKMAFQRLYEQTQHELTPEVGVANVLPGVVDTEGLRVLMKT